MDKGLDHIINKSFSSQDASEIPAWDSIKSKLDQKESLDALVEKSFAAKETIDIPDAWGQIEDQLIIDKTWSKIEASLDKRKRRRAGFFWLTTASMILFLTYYGYNQFGQYFTSEANNVSVIPNIESSDINSENQSTILTSNNSNEAKIEKTEINETSNTNTGNNTTVNNTAKPELIAANDFSAENNVEEEAFLADQKLIGQENENSTTEILSNDVAVNLENAELIKLEPKNTELISTNIVSNSIVISTRPKPRTFRMNLGLLYELNYNSINDSKSKQARESGSLVAENFSLGHSFGVFFTGKFNNNLLLGTELHLYNNLNRSLDEFENGYLVNQQLKLNYLKANFMLGYNFQFKKPQHSFELIGGPFLSYLMSSKETMSLYLGESQFEANDYSKFNFGLSFKAGLNHSFNRFSLGYGLSSSIGLLNIYRNDSKLLQDLNRTNTFESGLYIKFGINL